MEVASNGTSQNSLLARMAMSSNDIVQPLPLCPLRYISIALPPTFLTLLQSLCYRRMHLLFNYHYQADLGSLTFASSNAEGHHESTRRGMMVHYDSSGISVDIIPFPAY